MVATARIVRSDLLADRVRHTFADGTFQDRPYKQDANMENYVDMFPAENVLPDLALNKAGDGGKAE
jgi:hypothetical protein